MKRYEEQAETVNNYEKAAFSLAKENIRLKKEKGDLAHQINILKSQITYLNLKIDNKEIKRNISSITEPDKDLVKMSIYKWSPEKLLNIGEAEFQKKEFEKSAQFFMTFLTLFPKSNKINDRVLFQAGVSAYETKEHYDWALKSFGRLTEEYPESPFYRGAKLWKGLSHLSMGSEKAFFEVVEEFRKKYRNTPEWDILKPHYEKLVQKYK